MANTIIESHASVMLWGGIFVGCCIICTVAAAWLLFLIWKKKKLERQNVIPLIRPFKAVNPKKRALSENNYHYNPKEFRAERDKR